MPDFRSWSLTSCPQTRSTALPLRVLSAPCNYLLPISLLLKHLSAHVAQHWLVTYFQGFAHLQSSRKYLRSDTFLSCCVGSREHGWLRSVIKQLFPPARCWLGKAQFGLHKAEFVRCECLWLQVQSCQNSSCLNCLEVTNRGHPDHQPKYKLGVSSAGNTHHK